MEFIESESVEDLVRVADLLTGGIMLCGSFEEIEIKYKALETQLALVMGKDGCMYLKEVDIVVWHMGVDLN